MPKPRARRAMAWPIRPNPTMPKTRPLTSCPSIIRGPQIHGSRRRRNRSPSATRLAAAISSAQAVSAVVSVRTSGVFEHSTPRRVHAATSMLSNPTAKLATIASWSPATSRNSSSTLSVSSVTAPTFALMSARSCSRGMAPSPSYRVMSHLLAILSSAGLGSTRVTSTGQRALLMPILLPSPRDQKLRRRGLRGQAEVGPIARGCPLAQFADAARWRRGCGVGGPSPITTGLLAEARGPEVPRSVSNGGSRKRLPLRRHGAWEESLGAWKCESARGEDSLDEKGSHATISYSGPPEIVHVARHAAEPEYIAANHPSAEVSGCCDRECEERAKGA